MQFQHQIYLKSFKFNLWNNYKTYPIFYENIKININDVKNVFLGGEFPQFCKHKKGPLTSTSPNDFKFKNQKNNLIFNDIFL